MKSGAEGAHFFGALLLTFSFDKHTKCSYYLQAYKLQYSPGSNLSDEMHTVLILYLFYSGYLPWTFSSHFSHGFTQQHLTAGLIADDNGSAALGEKFDHIFAVGLKAQGE